MAKQSIAKKKDWSGLSKGDVEQRESFVLNSEFEFVLNCYLSEIIMMSSRWKKQLFVSAYMAIGKVRRQLS